MIRQISKKQGSFWPSENPAKTDRSKVNRCRTGSHEKSARTPPHTGRTHIWGSSEKNEASSYYTFAFSI